MQLKEKDVHYIGKINKSIYSCITKDIITDDVIITDERILHIKERHREDYEFYSNCLKNAVTEPDYILEANKPNTAFILKSINIEDKNIQLILRLVTSDDNPTLKNSIITFLVVSDKKWNKYLRNKKILYKKK